MTLPIILDMAPSAAACACGTLCIDDVPLRRNSAPDGSGASLARVRPLGDAEIRVALRLAVSLIEKDSLAVEEVPLHGGYVRADMITFSANSIHVVEIKGDRDRLDRLREQGRVYSTFADRVTLVVGWRHAAAALRRAPHWWGVWLAERVEPCNEGGLGVALVPLREALVNPDQKREALADLLTRNSALALLHRLRADRGVRSKARAAISARLADASSSAELRRAVRDHWAQHPPMIRARQWASRIAVSPETASP